MNLILFREPKIFGCALVNLEYMDGVSLQGEVFKKEKWYLVYAAIFMILMAKLNVMCVFKEVLNSKILVQIIEYRGVKVRRSVADLREANYRAQGKDCYVS